jgi:hypothetical protein
VHVRRSVRTAWLAGLAIAGGCSTGSGARGTQPEAELRIWVDPLVHWEAGADRHVDIAIENGTTRTISLAEPDPADARVAVFPGPDNLRVCGVEPREGPAAARPRVALPPGASLRLRVDLNGACAAVPPGEYRFEAGYRSPPAQGEKAFSGAFATRYGELVIEGAPARAGTDRADSPRAGRARPRR